MRSQSHSNETLIFTLCRHVNAWRKAEGWSRETVVQSIIDVHESSGADGLTGIHFEAGNRDQFTRMKTNADRVYRWLDDQGKDNNLLPANFIASILNAMPADRRLHCVNDILRNCDLAVHAICDEGVQLNPVHILQASMKETGEAHQAIANLINGASMDVLETTQREITEAIDALRRGLSAVNTAMAQQAKEI